MPEKGIIFVVSGPSGVGKGTTLKVLIDHNPNIKFSISATSREPRKGEIDGQQYFFVSEEKFQQMIKKEEFIEWVKYCGHYYGTPKNHVEEMLNNSFDVVFEIEVEGALNVKKAYPDSVIIFMLPPTFEELENRLQKRGSEREEDVQKRLERAKFELSFANRFDYAIINSYVEDSANKLESILIAEKLSVKRKEPRIP